MTRLWSEAQPIRMVCDSQGGPAVFYWQGRRHVLLRMVQTWRVDTDWWDAAGRIQRDYFAVLTTDGLLCVLYHDLLVEGWYLSRLYD